MTKQDDRIAKLEEKQAKIKAQIQRIKAQESKQKRKEETRKKVIIGAWILSKVESGEWPEKRLLDDLNEYLTRNHDRALFGLPPIENQNKQEEIIASQNEEFTEDSNEKESHSETKKGFFNLG